MSPQAHQSWQSSSTFHRQATAITVLDFHIKFISNQTTFRMSNFRMRPNRAGEGFPRLRAENVFWPKSLRNQTVCDSSQSTLRKRVRVHTHKKLYVCPIGAMITVVKAINFPPWMR